MLIKKNVNRNLKIKERKRRGDREKKEQK